MSVSEEVGGFLYYSFLSFPSLRLPSEDNHMAEKRFLYLLGLILFSAYGLLFADDSPDTLNRLTDHEKAAGFELLFDGQTLSPGIWQGSIDGYPVEREGAFVCRRGGQLLTKKEYADFIFRFEFRLPPAGNNGVGIRTPFGKHASVDGMEIQILSDAYKGAKPWQKHGSIYGIVPAKTGLLKPDGEWNREEIIAVGPHIKVIVNGQLAVDADLTKAEPIDGERPGRHNKTGSIGFLGHNDPVEFRNVRVLEVHSEEELREFLDSEK